jgi:hypothetical protein
MGAGQALRANLQLVAHLSADRLRDSPIRVAVQSAIPHPEMAEVPGKLVIETGIKISPADRTMESTASRTCVRQSTIQETLINFAVSLAFRQFRDRGGVPVFDGLCTLLPE